MYRNFPRMNVVVVFFPKQGLLHEMGTEHLESPKRLQVLYEALEEHQKELKIKFKKSEPVSKEDLMTIHTHNLVALIENSSKVERTYLTPDTITNSDTWKASLAAAGAAKEAVREAYKKKTTTVALVRPPGHHATSDVAMGFCFFNNIALAAELFLEDLSKKHRVLILDIDQHHGNGTQDIFYNRQDVLYMSLHCNPKYSFPGTGEPLELGKGKGLGYSINIPLPFETDDDSYMNAFDQIVLPIAKFYDPEIILISMGFDALLGDPYGELGLTPNGFFRIGSRIAQLKKGCKNRVACILEGGYKYEDLGEAIYMFLKGLDQKGKVEDVREEDSRDIERLKAIFRNYWEI